MSKSDIFEKLNERNFIWFAAIEEKDGAKEHRFSDGANIVKVFEDKDGNCQLEY